MAVSEFATVYNLSWRNAARLCILLNDFNLYDRVTKEQFYQRIGRTGHRHMLREPWSKFFKSEPRQVGVTLTADGRQAAAQWFTFLRRMLRQADEYVLRRFGFQVDTERRKKFKPFYQLPESEQIRLLREFCATSDTNERRRLRIEFRTKYGVASYELGGLIKKYGDLVKSARYIVPPNSSPRNVQ